MKPWCVNSLRSDKQKHDFLIANRMTLQDASPLGSLTIFAPSRTALSYADQLPSPSSSLQTAFTYCYHYCSQSLRSAFGKLGCMVRQLAELPCAMHGLFQSDQKKSLFSRVVAAVVVVVVVV
eukprot:52108-Amphidinium_carterae.1